MLPSVLVKLGISASLSGGTANLGRQIEKGARLAHEEKGNIKGFRLEAEAQDDTCNNRVLSQSRTNMSRMRRWSA